MLVVSRKEGFVWVFLVDLVVVLVVVVALAAARGSTTESSLSESMAGTDIGYINNKRVSENESHTFLK